MPSLGLKHAGVVVVWLVVGGCLLERGPEPKTPKKSEKEESAPWLGEVQIEKIDGQVWVQKGVAFPGHVLKGGETLEVLSGIAKIRCSSTEITLWAPSEILIAKAPARGIWLGWGMVLIKAEKTGHGPSHRPLRLSTPTSTIELGEGSQAIVWTEGNGSTHLFVRSGHAEVFTGEVDLRRVLKSIRVEAGTEIQVSERGEESVVPREDFEQALIDGISKVQNQSRPTLALPSPSFRLLLERFDEAIGWLEQEERKGWELAIRHRAAIRSGQQAMAIEQQKRLAMHAKSAYHLRETVLVRWERIGATALLSGKNPFTWSEIARRFERLSVLIGA
ncbi:MAG: hypothetical protein NZM37_01340 [Sandaracinaceae bacterium]|nr:hypothetical protein [Sandaracinaceae bacterium]